MSDVKSMTFPQPDLADSYPDAQVLQPAQVVSESEFDEQFEVHPLVKAIYEPPKRILSEEENKKFENMRAFYFQRGDLKDGLPIIARPPPRPHSFCNDSLQHPNRLPLSGASSHSGRLSKWTAIVGGAITGTAIALLLIKPRRKRNK